MHDERQPTEHVTYIGRHRSMFSLKFSQHNYLASGGNDGVVNIWDIRKLAKCNKIEAHGITKVCQIHIIISEIVFLRFKI